MEENKEKAILFPFATKEDGKVFWENWTLPANGNYPEKSFRTITFYNLLEDQIDRLNLSAEELEKVIWQDADGNELSGDEIAEHCFAHLSDGVLPVVYFVFQNKRKGRYSVSTLVRVEIIKTFSVLTS